MNKGQVARIILAKVLSLPLRKYLAFLEDMTQEPKTPCPAADLAERKQAYAEVVVEDGAPGFRVCDPRLLKIYPVPESSDDKRACSLNWINTRNRFSAHIAHKLLQCQRDYWLSGREADLRPLGLQQFLALYPLDHLDASRLSRLLARLWVLTPRHELICLRRLFPSRKRVAALRIKELISQSPRCLKDREVQSALARQGTDLSLRTICSCRKALNIPNHKERLNGYYGTDAAFGESLRLAGKKSSRVPAEPGVYELSLPWKLEYPKGRSEVIYLGCTRDLRKRIASYSVNGLKNHRLTEFLRQGQVLVRFCRAQQYRALEKKLLSNFRNHHGVLPKANSVGA
ncbi:MAG: hypothetical protein AAB676_02745 [Verrucomicrobiota bacterium]